jgi:hypothetical protein
MELLDTPQEYIKRQETKGLIDTSLTATRVVEVWDNLWKGDDNSEDDSKLGLFSDMTVWDAIKAISQKADCPDVVTIQHSRTGEWRRTTWRELVAVTTGEK